MSLPKRTSSEPEIAYRSTDHPVLGWSLVFLRPSPGAPVKHASGENERHGLDGLEGKWRQRRSSCLFLGAKPRQPAN